MLYRTSPGDGRKRWILTEELAGTRRRSGASILSGPLPPRTRLRAARRFGALAHTGAWPCRATDGAASRRASSTYRETPPAESACHSICCPSAVVSAWAPALPLLWPQPGPPTRSPTPPPHLSCSPCVGPNGDTQAGENLGLQRCLTRGRNADKGPACPYVQRNRRGRNAESLL